VPLDAIPDLPASQTTSGTFAAARIPPLDGSIIATGTVAAARLPASVTANANALPVADIAARDAIPLVNRVNGMLVFVESTKQLFEWQAAGSIWNLVGAGMDSEISATTWLNANFAAFGPGTYPPLRVWFNTTTRRLTTELMVTRTTNSASATVHSPLVIPAQYRAAFYTSGPVLTNIGGTEKAVRCTVLNTTGSVDIVLPAAAIWTASTHWVNVAISWVVPLP
jgi:hypothetical protein